MSSALQFSLSEILAGLGILGVIGGAAIWALETRFPNKKLLNYLREKDSAAAMSECAKLARDIAEVRTMAENCNNQHLLAKAPFEGVIVAMQEMRSAFADMSEAARKRDEAMSIRDQKTLEAFASLDKRLALVEAARQRATRRRG